MQFNSFERRYSHSCLSFCDYHYKRTDQMSTILMSIFLFIFILLCYFPWAQFMSPLFVSLLRMNLRPLHGSQITTWALRQKSSSCHNIQYIHIVFTFYCADNKCNLTCRIVFLFFISYLLNCNMMGDFSLHPGGSKPFGYSIVTRGST